jgi:hypothetical protein
MARLCPLLGVHPTRPRRPGSRCPAVRCPARPGSGHLAPSSGRGCPADACPTRPASSRLVSARPPGHSRLGPRPPDAGDRGALGTAGSGLDWIESSSVWSGPVPGGSVDGPEEAWLRAPLRRLWAGRRGSVGRGLGRVVLRREAAPTDQEARPPSGAPVVGGCARVEGLVGAMLRMAPRGGHWLGATTTLRGHCGARRPSGRARKDQTSSAVRPACGPGAAQPGSERDWLDVGKAMTCKNGGGRDRV